MQFTPGTTQTLLMDVPYTDGMTVFARSADRPGVMQYRLHTFSRYRSPPLGVSAAKAAMLLEEKREDGWTTSSPSDPHGAYNSEDGFAAIMRCSSPNDVMFSVASGKVIAIGEGGIVYVTEGTGEGSTEQSVPCASVVLFYADGPVSFAWSQGEDVVGQKSSDGSDGGSPQMGVVVVVAAIVGVVCSCRDIGVRFAGETACALE